jgi:methionine salvage enolase-phosphatase E1
MLKNMLHRWGYRLSTYKKHGIHFDTWVYDHKYATCLETCFSCSFFGTMRNLLQTYIYSSGSREAQRLIFGNTTYGDLRKICVDFLTQLLGTFYYATKMIRLIDSLSD